VVIRFRDHAHARCDRVFFPSDVVSPPFANHDPPLFVSFDIEPQTTFQGAMKG
jgi:hypothetical protein